MIDESRTPNEDLGNLRDSLGIRKEGGLSLAIQQKIAEFGNYADATIAGLVSELRGLHSELQANPGKDRVAEIDSRVSQIFVDLGTPRET